MPGCVNLCLGMFEWAIWRSHRASIAPTHSTARLVVVHWKDQTQKSYYFARENQVERSQDSWAYVVHKDLAQMEALALASIEPASPIHLGLLPGMEDTAEA